MQQLYGPDNDGVVVDKANVMESYPWPEGRVWVRAMMVTTLDGAAVGPDGRSGTISSDADRHVFDAVRRDTDVVLVGAETLRVEQYTPMKAKPADTSRREAAGQLPAPVIAIVSGSLDLPWTLPIWAQSTHTPLILTPEDADEDKVATARSYAEVITLKEVSPQAIVDALAARGLRRIVCEGGPSLLQAMIAADLVDEVDITIAPLVSGNDATARTAMLDEPTRYRLVQVLEAEEFLMTRYLAEGR